MAEEKSAQRGGRKKSSPQVDRDARQSFIVVGIGASAGGLKALQHFFDRVPPGSGMAYVIVSHLSPEHVSHLPNLLQQHTAMPVAEVTDTVEIVADHVYVIPPNRYLSAIDTHLRLSKTEGTQRPRSPIDHFFRTLADTHGEQAIGIVLSGTGSDGTLGIKRIKERGGLIAVQDPDEAEYDGMPQSAIGAGVVDFILPVQEIPAQLARYAQSRPQFPVTGDGEPATEPTQEAMQKIVAQLRGHTGHDFSHYKPSTFTRRVHRRMQIQQVDELADYLRILRANREEVTALFRDLLITVTNFFRDRESFDSLEQEVIPRILAGKTEGRQVRAWVVGCATGEEAYILAMLFLEHASRLDYSPEIQIFASDISQDALGQARVGLYPEAIAVDVPPERLERFFQKEPGGYRIRKEVRERVLFVSHNLLKDPPFSRQDLISCRNLLIYLKREAQHQIFELFHYTLRPEGYLFLGPSETVEGSGLFREVGIKHGIFQSLPSVTPRLPALPFTLSSRTPTVGGALDQREVISSAAIHRRMIERFAPPSVLVNADYNIVHLSEGAGRYLRQPGGEPTNNILQRVRPPFRIELTTMLYGAFKKEKAAESKLVRATIEGKQQDVILSVYPAREADLEGFTLIVFEDSEETQSIEKEPREATRADNATIRELEAELEQTKRWLQTTIDEFETSKEEMKASNEELQSTNEELRSTAEELETSKEELQSMNEELITLNQENKNKVEELSQLTGDLQNLLVATDIATLFLDRDLRVKRFTPPASELFNILASDSGRPLAHLTHKLGYTGLLDDTTSVLRTLVPIEREVYSEDGRWYLTRFLPYRTVEDRIDGVVITFVDVTELKRAQQEVQRRVQQQAAVAMLGRLALEDVELDSLFNEAAKQVCETLEVEFSEVLELQPDEEALLLKAGQGWDENDIGQVVTQAGEKPSAGFALHRNEPHLVEEWRREKRFKLPDHLAERGIVSSASVVIPGLRQPYGVLRAHSRQKRSFSQEEVNFLQAVATLLAEAIERKQSELRLKALNETLEERVRERTTQVRTLASQLISTEQQVRQRISQVLHEDLQQLLFATQVHVQLVKDDLAAGKKKLSPGQVDEVKNMIEEGLRITRRLSIDLSPPVLQSQNFGESLKWLVHHMRELHGLEVKLTMKKVPEPPGDDMHLLLFQMVREALFNVVKHAGINQAELRAFAQGDDLVVQVIDEGAGFDVAAALKANSSYGLRHMRERLRLFGGRMDIESSPGQGTTITIAIPQRRVESLVD